MALVSLHDRIHNKNLPAGCDFGADWRSVEIPIDELVDHVCQGKAWVNCQLSGRRNTENFVASNLIVLDVDGDLTLEEFWDNPFAQRHCAFTYTSCSHGSDEKQKERGSRTNHSFRAVFAAERIDNSDGQGAELHAERYHLLMERLGLDLKDSSPAKAAQPWFGNDQAQLRFAQPVILDWEFTEDAKDRIRTRAQKRQQLAAAARPSEDDGLDEARAVFILDHLLRPSQDGEFPTYWVQVFNACASSGSEKVREAFMAWHGRGHHSKTQKGVEKRYDRAGNRSGLGKLFALAVEQHGRSWWQLLPEGLRRSGMLKPPPITLMSSRSVRDIQPQEDFSGSEIPDAVSPGQLQRISFNLMAASSSAPRPDQITDPHEEILWRIYRLEVELIHQCDDGDVAVDELEAERLQIAYRDQLYQSQVYGREPWRIDQALLRIFKQQHNLARRSKRYLAWEHLGDVETRDVDWLIPGLLIRGRNYLLYSKAGMGKTTMALMIARAVTGTPDHNTFLDCSPVPLETWGTRTVLYIASDGGDGAVFDLKTYACWHKMDGSEWIDNHFLVMGQSEKNQSTSWRMNLYEMHLLSRMLDEAQEAGRPISMIVFDSLKAICPRNVRVGDQVIVDYVEMLQEICGARNVTSLIVHHQSKDGDHFQGAVGISEVVSGVFSIKEKDGERCFCIEKTRVDRRGNRELPYVIDNGRLVSRSTSALPPEQTDEGKILAILQDHWDRHRKRVAHLGQSDTHRFYKGIDRDSLRIALVQKGGNGKKLYPKRVKGDLLKDMLTGGQIKSLAPYHYSSITSSKLCLDGTDSFGDLDGMDDAESTFPGWD